MLLVDELGENSGFQMVPQEPGLTARSLAQNIRQSELDLYHRRRTDKLGTNVFGHWIPRDIQSSCLQR
jgi:hypothetical protein